jgi:hypothetical protein
MVALKICHILRLPLDLVEAKVFVAADDVFAGKPRSYRDCVIDTSL